MGQGEVTLGVGDVLGDLGEERFRAGEAALVTEAAQEGQAERGLLGKGLRAFEGVEVEQVRLYGEGVRAEGGAVANVGDGLKGLGVRGTVADLERGDVDAVGGKNLDVGG